MAVTQDFAGRLALITGARGAIGAATCDALRARGARVVAADASAPQAAAGDDLTRSEGLHLDVRDTASVRALVARVCAECGPIDTLVNVAGVVSFGAAETLAEAEWDRVIDINLKGTFVVCKALIPVMKEARFGRIVNIGSVVGKNAGNARAWLDPAELDRAGNVAYGVSKAGVHVMTGFLAKELAAFGITVNAVAPGPIATAMTTQFPDTLRALLPVGRMGKPEDVARAIVFLTARESGFITGEVLDVNGGIACD